MKAAYRVVVRSRVGMRSEVLEEPHIELTQEVPSVRDLLDFIERTATTLGFRDFTVTTIGDSIEGIPLETRREGEPESPADLTAEPSDDNLIVLLRVDGRLRRILPAKGTEKGTGENEGNEGRKNWTH